MSAIRFCGLGLMEPEEVERMLAGDYKKKVPPAAPEGLILWHIAYDDVEFQGDVRGIGRAKRDLFERYSRALTRAALFGNVLLEL